MSKSVFTKNRIKGYFVFLLIAAVLAIGASVGLFFYYGHTVSGKELGKGGLNERLRYGESFSSSEVISEQGYKFEWIKSDGVNVEVFAYDEQDKPYSTTEILDFNPEKKTFSVVGVAKGFIEFSNPFDSTVSFSVPFETRFSSNDTRSILTENYPDKFVNGQFFRSAIESVSILTFKDKEKVDFSDFAKFSNLKRVNVKNSENILIEFKNFSIPNEARIYVSESAYPAYMASDNEVLKNYSDKIFVSVENVLNHSIVLYKNGGLFENDNGKDFDSLEEADGGNVALSTKYAMKRLGYTFEGWYSGDGKTFKEENKVDDDYVVTSDMKLYAKWSANEYVVSVHANDGTDKKYDLQFKYDEEKSLLDSGKILTYTGFYQIGWAYDENASSVEFEVEDIVKNLATEKGSVVNVYAIWIYREFTLQFYTWDENKEYKKYGDEKHISNQDDLTLTPSLGRPTSIHGSFVGWTFNKDVPKVEHRYTDYVSVREVYKYITSKGDGVVNVYAVIELESYDLYYNSNGGSTTPESKKAISRGVSVVLSKPITKTGYQFKGWLDNAGYLWTSERLYSADKTWYDTEYVNALQKVDETDEGFNAPNGINTVRSSTQVTLFAIFKANTFGVKFYGNGGSYYNDCTVTFGNGFTFTGENAKRGYSVESCKFNATRSGATVGSADVSVTGRSISKEQISAVYAALKKGADNDFDQSAVAYFEVKWIPVSYNVSYDVLSQSKRVSYDSPYGELAAIEGYERNGKKYKFDHWEYAGSTVTKDTVMQVASDHTLIAVGTEISTGSGPCLLDGTLVTMFDGSNKKIDDISIGDKVRVWNFEKGCYSVNEVAFIEHNAPKTETAIDLTFADGTVITVIGEHGFFDADSRKFIYFTKDSAESLVGRKFLKQTEVNGALTCTVVELVGVKVEVRFVGSHSMVVAEDLAHFANDYLSIAADIDGLFNIFEVDEDLKYDQAAMQKDIETYGLYDYEVFAEYITYEQFVAFGGAYLKVSVGKGLTTFENVIELINKYLK